MPTQLLVVSGEAASMFVPFYAAAAVPPQWAATLLVLGTVAGFSAGFVRVIQGAHFLSDVVFCRLVHGADGDGAAAPDADIGRLVALARGEPLATALAQAEAGVALKAVAGHAKTADDPPPSAEHACATLPLPGGKPAGVTRCLTFRQQRRRPSGCDHDRCREIALDLVEISEGFKAERPPWLAIRSFEQRQLNVTARQSCAAVGRRQFPSSPGRDPKFSHPALLFDFDQVARIKRQACRPLSP